MDKKIITFFLASSINDLEYDRLAIGDFVNQLNNIYQSSGVFIKLYKCESDTLDHSIRFGGSQASLDDIIRTSDICFVVFWHKVGDVTFHELNVALKASQQNGVPKIVVYFKRLADNEKQSEDIQRVMHIIDNELLHYHREYSHIDSLKLGIITQLQVHGFVNANLSVKDNKIVCMNDTLMSVDKIPLFAENAEYLELLERYSQVVKKCKKLQQAYAENNMNSKIVHDLSKAIKERDRLKADLDELSESILDIGKRIASITVNGGMITEKIKQAIKCFDAGDYDGVLELLDPSEIEKNIMELDKIEEHITAERIAIVEEYRIRILALKAQSRWKDVHNTYLKAIEQVNNRPQMPKTIMYEYAAFLFNQTRYNECLEICISLITQVRQESNFDKKFIWRINNLLGVAYYKIGDYKNAKDRLEHNVGLLSEEENSTNGVMPEYAEAYVNLAQVYYCIDNHAKAKDLYQKALRIYKTMDESLDVQKMIIDIDIWLAQLYYQTNRHSEAEKLLSAALSMCEDLAKIDSSYEEPVAELSSKIANINRAILVHRKEDRCFIGALKFRNRLLGSKKESFSEFLKNICIIMSDEYARCGYRDYCEKLRELDKSVEVSISANCEEEITDFDYYFDKHIDERKLSDLGIQALNIREKLAKENPEAYVESVIKEYKNLADIYILLGKNEEAEHCLEKSLTMEQNLLFREKNELNMILAAIYCSYAGLHKENKSYSDSEKMYYAALDIYSLLPHSNEYARTINYLARLYGECGKKQLADEKFFYAFILYIDLYKKSPGAYIDRIINTAADILHSIHPDKEKEIMNQIMKI